MGGSERRPEIKQGDLMKREMIISSEGNLLDESLFLQHCEKLAEIVCNKHYNYVKQHDRDDLYSVAIMKAFDLLSKGDYLISSGSLKSYLYTGMRNEMGNFLYHNKKESPIESEIIDVNPDLRVHVLEISEKEIRRIIKEFPVNVCLDINRVRFYLSQLGVGRARIRTDLNLTYDERKFIVYFFWRIKNN